METLTDGNAPEHLLVFDSLNPLTAPSHSPMLLPAFFTSILPNPSYSLVGVYHADVPILRPQTSEYAPHPLTLLTHIATAVFHVSSLAQAVEAQRAKNRSLPVPEHGLREGREGVLIGLVRRDSGVVVDMEMRRRSGRSVVERFILTPASPAALGAKTSGAGGASIMLLSDHPLFAAPAGSGESDAGGRGGGEGGGMQEGETTFSLGLTEKQRRDREGIVLPYFDAQTDIGAGEGGRILYDMGREDDFDDEEDEI